MYPVAFMAAVAVLVAIAFSAYVGARAAFELMRDGRETMPSRAEKIAAIQRTAPAWRSQFVSVYQLCGLVLAVYVVTR